MNFVFKYIVLVFFVGLGSIQVMGQTRLIGERGIQLQTFVSPVLINPGATGFSGDQVLLFNYRNAWSSFPDGPSTVTFSYDGPIGNRLSFGAQLLSDRFASLENTKGLLSLAYMIESDVNKLNIGLSAEYIQHKLSSDELSSTLVDPEDQVIMRWLDGAQYFDLSFGIYGIYENTFTYGVTFPSLVSSRINNENFNDDLSRSFSYIVNLGVKKYFDEQDILLEPSIHVKQLMLTPFHVDLNLKADFLDQRLTGGMNYTIGADRRLGFLIGAKLSNFGFYYSYNISFHQFQQYNNGSHEFSLKFNLSEKDRSTTKK